MPDPSDSIYENLCAEYDPVISRPIILASPQDPTIFDISGYPHYEEVISNWYAFFFDPLEKHSLQDLFLKSLIEIINEVESDFSMEACLVEREYKGFIDLLLYELSGEDENYKSAVVIENKIYAPLYNDLDYYYSSVEIEASQKVGIVLSLHKIKNKNLPKEFINITHERLLEVIQRNLGQYVASAKLKYIHSLQDFISNLEQMTRPEKMQDNIIYYFDNATKIDELLNLKDQAELYLRENLRNAVARNNYEWKRSSEGAFRFAYRFGNSNYCILFYLYTIRKICTEKKFLLSVWLYGEAVVNHWRSVDGRIQIRRNEYQLEFNEDSEEKEWEYIAEKEYEIPDIEQFGDTVFHFLNQDWALLLKQVTELLRTDAYSRHWLPNEKLTN